MSRDGVLAMMKLPPGATDGDVEALVQPFGGSNDMYFKQPSRDMVWVLLNDASQAEAAVEYWKGRVPVVRGQKVHVTIAKTVPPVLRKGGVPSVRSPPEVPRPAGRPAGGKAGDGGKARKGGKGGKGGKGDSQPPRVAFDDDDARMGDLLDDEDLGISAQGRIIHFTVVDDPDCRLTADLLRKVAAKPQNGCGVQPEKIIVTHAPPPNADPLFAAQGWIQMPTASSCYDFINHCSGRSMHAGKMVLSMAMSHKSSLKVDTNDHMHWDAALEGRTVHTVKPAGPALNSGGPPAQRVLHTPQLKAAATGFQQPSQAAPDHLGPAAGHSAYTQPAAGRGRGVPAVPATSDHAQVGKVILVTGMHDRPFEGMDVQRQAFTPDTLRKLLCQYGVVMKVLFLPRKNFAEALVEFCSAEDAQRALDSLRGGVPLFGTTVKFSPSRRESVDGRKATQDEFEEWTSDPALRRRKGARHILVPSTTLFITGLPVSFTDENMQTCFGQYSCVAAEVFSQKPGQGRVEFATVEEAAKVLVWIQSCTSIGEFNFTDALRVSFASGSIRKAARTVAGPASGVEEI